MGKEQIKKYEVKNGRLYLDEKRTIFKERTVKDYQEELCEQGNECAYHIETIKIDDKIIYLWGDEETFEHFFTIIENMHKARKQK